jgi:hypothetical protein
MSTPLRVLSNLLLLSSHVAHPREQGSIMTK